MPLILPRPPWPIVNETATDAPTRQLTVAAENTPIPILYGEDQLGARLLAVKVDEPNNRVVISCGWCLGEIEGIDQIYFDGTPAPAGVTFTHYLGTPSQGIDPALQGAIAGYSDTNVITVGGVNVGTAYTVAIIPKGIKVPRNVTADLRGLKLYDPRQNRIRQSETYSNAAWGKTRVTVSSPGGNAPTGAAITKLAETTGSGTHLISITESASASTLYRASIWIQAAGRDKGRFTLDGESIDFDLTAVTAGAGHIVSEGSGWYRIDLKATTGGAASSISYQLNILNASGNDSYTGNGSSGFNLGGSLIVQSAESYPYIKTTTAHITPATAYSTNPALVLADFYASTVYGKGQTPNYGSAAKCAVANDESVGGSARRSIGLAIERIASVEQWVETQRTYAACFIDPSGDKPTFIPDRPAPTRRTLTESDIVENTLRLTRRSGRDVPTVVTVIYTDKTVTPYRDAEATAKISGVDTGTVQRREITLRLPGIDSHEQAYREAVEQLNALRLIAEDIEFETYDDAIVDSIGDIIALNISNPIPISGDLYRIMSAEPVHGGGSAWRISAAAHTDLIYSDSVQAGSHVNDTVMPDASSIDGPTSLNATSSTEINIDGTPITALNVTWTAATSIYVDRYQIEYKRSDDIDWQRAETQNTNYQIKPVIPSISYDIRVRTASQLVGIYSAWVSLTISATGKGDIPAAPTNLSTLDTFYGIVLTWTNPAIDDLAHIEIWRSADNNRANATHINDVIGTSYTDGNVGGTAYYWIRAVNTSEIASDWHPTSATGGIAGTKSNLDSAAADTTAPTDPGSLALTTGVEEANLTVIAWVKGTWSASTDDGILAGYQVQWWTSEDATKISTFAPTGTTEYRIVPVKPGLTTSMRVRAEDWAGNVSNWTTTQSIVVTGDTVAPAKPTGISITAGIQKVIVDWVNPTDDDFLETEVYIGTTSGFTPGSANLRFTGRGTRFVWDGGTIGQNYYAKLQARDVTGNPSGYTTVVGPAAPFNVRTVDLENELLTTAKFASSIKPVEIVGTLPAAGTQGRIVLLTTDNKLYRDTGTVWTTDIPASDVTGQLTDSQIAAISAAKLTGQIASTQITDDAITTPKLAAGAVTSNEIAAGTIVAGNIQSDTITAVQIATNTLTAGQIAAGAISAIELAADAVVAGKIATGTIVAGDGVIATAAIQNAQIDTVDAAKITTGTLDANRIAAGSITAGKLSVSQLSAIAADLGTVTAGILQGAIVRTAASGARVQLNSTNGVEVFNSGGTRTVHLNKDGSGYVGSAGALSWNTTGTVTIPGSLIAGEIVGNTIKTAVSGWRVTLNESGIPIRYWDGTNTHFSVDGSGNVDLRSVTVRDTDGTILLQSGGNLDYTRVGGTKPPSNADRTADNTAAAIAGQGAFATLNQITSSNVSTYIANAAILNAQIANIIQASATAADGQPTWKLDKTGAIDARSITIRDTTGTVILQSGGNLDYARVGGTKPPSNADRTADNIAAGAQWPGVTGTGRPTDNADVTGDIIDKSGGSLLPNWDLNVVDSTGKPAGIRATQGLADRGGVAVHSSNSSAITLSHPSIDFFAYGFPAIPIDDKSEYLVTIKHSSSASTADGLYLRFEELNTPLPLGMTHIGSGTKDSAATDRTSLIDIVSNGPMPGSAGWVEATYTYKPTAGVKYASFAMYKWGTGTGHNYSVHAVQIRPTLQQITSSNITTFIANLAVDTLQIAGNAVTIPVGAYTSSTYSHTGTDTNWHQIQSAGAVSLSQTSSVIVIFSVYLSKGDTAGEMNLRIRRDDGVIVLDIAYPTSFVQPGKTYEWVSKQIVDSAPSGNRSYYLEIQRYFRPPNTPYTFTMNAAHRSLSAIAAKK